MKKIITILAMAMVLISCNSNESKMKSEIKDYLDKNAKDPSSYEFIDLKVTDTIIAGKFAQTKIDINNDEIKNNEKSITTNTETLKSAEANKAKYKDDSFDEFINGAKEDIETANKAISDYKNENEKLKKYLGSKDILGYVALHKCRMKNGLGALDIGTYYAEFDKDIKLLQFDKDIDYSIFEFK